MKYTAISVLILATGSLFSPAAPAQDHRSNVTIPFTFTVGSTTLPPGQYQVSSLSNTHVLRISGWNQPGAMVMGLPGRDNYANSNKLVFHKYGQQYFLSEVCSEDSTMNLHFTPSKAEKKARTEIEQAMRFPEDPVLVALNK